MIDPASIPANFALGEGERTGVERLGIGHINDTYIGGIRDRCGRLTRYIFQRINTAIFPDVEALMENLRRITDHLADGGRSLRLVRTLAGADYHRDPAGGCWRAFPLIEGTVTHAVLSSPEQARQAGSAFGEFSRKLSTLPAPPLHEIIPDFHHTAKRFENFAAAVAADPANRAAVARAEIDSILACSAWATIITDAQAAGQIPGRVAHNDAKIENILFDAAGGGAVCVVDLDTAMPGSVLHDFGDLVRTAAATTTEDEPDLARVGVSLPTFRSLAEGFLAGCGEMLTPAELGLLPSAGKVIVYEQALRFLTDYLLGDRYYRIRHPEHNLERARNQIRLAGLLDGLQPDLESIITNIHTSCS